MSETPQRRRRHPPGPSGVPVVQNTFQYAEDPLEFITTVAREYGPVAEYTIGGISFYQVSDPELVEHVLVQENQRYIKGELFQESLGTVLGDGLLTSEGAFWREHRHRLQPAFHPDQIADAAETMTTYASDVASEWTDGEYWDDSPDATGDALAAAVAAGRGGRDGA